CEQRGFADETPGLVEPRAARRAGPGSLGGSLESSQQHCWPRHILCSVGQRGRRGGGGGLIPCLQGEQLLTEDRHITRGFDPQADLAPVDVHDRDTDVFTDNDLFTEFAAEDQHVATLLRARLKLSSCRILRHESRGQALWGGLFHPEDRGKGSAVSIPRAQTVQPCGRATP